MINVKPQAKTNFPVLAPIPGAQNIVIHSDFVGVIIGKGWATINELKSSTGANVEIGASPDESLRVVQVSV